MPSALIYCRYACLSIHYLLSAKSPEFRLLEGELKAETS